MEALLRVRTTCKQTQPSEVIQLLAACMLAACMLAACMLAPCMLAPCYGGY
jgi:hypothetical protein